MKKTALIMAGGRGERFWPKSRQNLPKQFLSLTDDDKTMIQLTVERILPLVDMEDIFIATNQDYKALVREQLPQLPEQNILCEPVGKNTAPCIGLGAVHIAKKYEDALMFVLPSDHLIKMHKIFLRSLQDACDVAEQGENLVTIGITPSSPETGYGYIRFDAEHTLCRAFKVEQFVEKPNLEKAKEYLASGLYMWNSGMFTWKVSTILKNIQTFMPQTYEGLQRIGQAIGTEQEKEVLVREFTAFKSESIDYGIMEKASNIYILTSAFGWDDVGSWLAVGRIKKTNDLGNVVNGNAITVDTQNTIIQGDKKLIATVGLENMIIVDTPDALLVCEKDHAGEERNGSYQHGCAAERQEHARKDDEPEHIKRRAEAALVCEPETCRHKHCEHAADIVAHPPAEHQSPLIY